MTASRNILVACLAGAAASAAFGGPVTQEQVARQKAAPPPSVFGGHDSTQAWMDNFDSYAAGSLLAGQGGWDYWPGAPLLGTVIDNPPANSAPNSLLYESGFDLVRTFNYTGGVFLFRAMVYNPSTAIGNDGYIIMLNSYDGGGAGTKWSLQVLFRNSTQTVSNDVGGFTLAPTQPLIWDAWTEYGAMIDLTNDRLFDWYNGNVLTKEWITSTGPQPLRWTVNALNPATAPGAAEVHTLDIYSASVTGMQIDDILLTCYADNDQSTGVGVLDIFDFLGFGNMFSQGHPYACDVDVTQGYGVCDIFDFLAFGNLFSAGCP